MWAEFLKIAFFVAGQKNAKKILKMSKFTKAPEVKKYKNMSVRIWTFGFNFINEMKGTI